MLCYNSHMKNIAFAYAAALLSATAATCDAYDYKDPVAREVGPARVVTNAVGRTVVDSGSRTASLRGLTVGISDTCSTNGAIGVGWYVESVRRVGGTPVVVCRTDDSAGLDAVVTGLDLLVLTGGEDVAPARYGEKPSPRLGRVNAVRDAYEWALLSAAVRHGVPIFGTCRGEQVLNVFFGGTLYQDLPSEFPFNDREVHRSPRRRGEAKCEHLHDILIEPGSRLASVCGGAARLPVNSSHHQAVKGLAPGFRVAARSPEGVVEAIECDWYPAAGVQFHPEILLACNGDPVWTRFYGKLSEFAGRRRPVSRASHPIGVFDSGIGGLSVLEKMLTLDSFDNETGEMKPDGGFSFRYADGSVLNGAVNDGRSLVCSYTEGGVSARLRLAKISGGFICGMERGSAAGVFELRGGLRFAYGESSLFKGGALVQEEFRVPEGASAFEFSDGALSFAQ